MSPRKLALALTLAIAALTVVPEWASAQLRTDAKAVQTAKDMRAKRASASDVATALRRMRQDPAQITAVLREVGYATRSIAEVHQKDFRFGAPESAKTWMEASGDANLAFSAMSLISRSNAETMQVARDELRMSAKQVVQQTYVQQRTGKVEAERVYADMKTAGFSTGAIVKAIAEGLESTPSEIFDAMQEEGAKLDEITAQLQTELQMTVEQIGELLDVKGVDTAAGAAALEGLASPTELVHYIFREAAEQQIDDQAYWAERAEILADYVDSGEAAIEAVAEIAGPTAMVAVGVTVAVVKTGMGVAGLTADKVQTLVAKLMEMGVTVADLLPAAEVMGFAQHVVAQMAFIATGSAELAATRLSEILGWSAETIAGALEEIVPITVDFVAHLLGLGSLGDKLGSLIGKLRDQGVSALAVIAGIGEQLGVVGVAQALWDVGYSGADIAGGLVEEMQVSATEAAAVVAGLAGG